MNATEIINSGDLELYVYGLLNEEDNKRIADLAKNHPEIEAEIVSIEKSILALSSSFAPQIPSDTFEKIKARLQFKHQKTITLNSRAKKMEYWGWAASITLLLGVGFHFYQMNQQQAETRKLNFDNVLLQQNVVSLEQKVQQMNETLSMINDSNNTIVALAGQTIAPNASAKVYWNKEKQVVYIDASKLPEPPKGMEYQVWSLKLSPLTPTSIGLLNDFNKNEQKIFKLEATSGAEAFGVTLEPAGGSKTPTLEKLYVLGKV